MSDHAASVQGLALRVARLGPDGAPLVGTKNAWVTNAFMSFGWTPEYTEGDEIEEKAADGSVCVYYKMPDVLKRVTFELAICGPEPELSQLLAGGTVLEDEDENVIGYAAPATGTDPTPDGVSLELWSRAIVGGKPAAVNPFWEWLFPYAQMKPTGSRTLENGMMANTYEGYGVGNAAFGTGPQNEWDQSSDAAYQYIRTATFPTGINGFQAVIAQT